MSSDPLLRQLTNKGRNPLEVEIYDVLREEGIQIADYWYVQNELDLKEAEEEMKRYKERKFVAKVMSPRIVHKSDFKAVLLGIDLDEVGSTFKRLQKDFSEFIVEGIMFAPMVDNGVEFLIGSTTDPTFGPITIFGVGGTLVEVIKDVTFGKSPVSRYEALDMIGLIEHQDLLDGPRGMPKADRIELAELIQKISQISYKYRDIVSEIDLNPVRVTNEGIIPLDARIIFHPDQCR